MIKDQQIVTKMFSLLNRLKVEERRILDEIRIFVGKNQKNKEIIVQSLIEQLNLSKGLMRLRCYFVIDIILKNYKNYHLLLEKELIKRFAKDLASFEKSKELKVKMLKVFLSWEQTISISALKKMISEYYRVYKQVDSIANPFSGPLS